MADKSPLSSLNKIPEGVSVTAETTQTTLILTDYMLVHDTLETMRKLNQHILSNRIVSIHRVGNAYLYTWERK